MAPRKPVLDPKRSYRVLVTIRHPSGLLQPGTICTMEHRNSNEIAFLVSRKVIQLVEEQLVQSPSASLVEGA